MSIKIEHNIEMTDGVVTRDRYSLVQHRKSLCGGVMSFSNSMILSREDLDNLISEVERIKSQLEKK